MPVSIAFAEMLAAPDRFEVGPGAITIEGDRIAGVAPGEGADGILAMPPLPNAHDHGRGMRTLAFGAADDALELWLTRLGGEPITDPYLRAAVAFGRMAESGIGIANHCHNTQRPLELFAEAQAAARAAADVGIRVAFAVPIMDANPIAYGDPAPLLDSLAPAHAQRLRDRAARALPSAEQLARAEEIFALQTELFSVQYGPVAPQWVDDATLEIVAERSARHDRRVHMHALETRLQREWADARHPEGLFVHLDAIGLLSPRLTIAHGTYLTPDECALLAERGVSVSVNTSSNLRLRSGIAPVADMIAAGTRFGMGLDGMAFDDDEDALREMRMLWHLQRGFGVTDVMDRERLLRAVLVDGRAAIVGEDGGGVIAAGAPADILTLDTSRIRSDTVPAPIDAIDLLLSRARREDVRDLWIAGRQTVAAGRCTGIDLAAAEAELTAMARANASPADREALLAIEAAYRTYYRCGCHTAPASQPQEIATP